MPEIHLDNYLISGIFALLGMGLKFIANMSYSLRDISSKISQFHDVLSDHEQRLRVVENKKTTRG